MNLCLSKCTGHSTLKTRNWLNQLPLKLQIVFSLGIRFDKKIRYGRYQLFKIDTIPIRYQGFLVVSIPNFDTDTSKFEPSGTVFL